MHRSADRPPRAPRVLQRLALGPLAALGWILTCLPSGFRLWVGRRLGDLAYRILPGRRAVARRNLARAFGTELSAPELDKLRRESFQHFGMMLVESCTFFFRLPPVLLSRVEVEGLEHLKAGLAQGRGVLILTAHFGNWELLATAHVLTGYSLSVVVRPMDSPILDWLVTRVRERSGVEVITKRRALPAVLDALRRQRMVAILLDQNATRREGVFTPFFGQPASTSKSLALLALRTEAPVIPVFIRREPGGGHRVVIEPEIRLPRTGDRRKDIVAYTRAFTRCVEDTIRRRPEQWLWMHDRWRTRPPGSSSPLTPSPSPRPLPHWGRESR